MIKPHITLQRLILAAVVALPLTVSAAADAPSAAPMAEQGAGQPDGGPDGQGGPGGPGPGMHGGPQEGPQHGPGFGPGGPGQHEGRPGPDGFGPGPQGFGPGHGGMPPFLHGLELSEAQGDKLFAIVYAQEPVIREQHKIVQKSHEALREMEKSGKYDDAKAVSLVNAISQAMAKLTLLKLRGDQQILALLTPEQRKQIAQREADHAGDKDGPHRPPRPQPQGQQPQGQQPQPPAK